MDSLHFSFGSYDLGCVLGGLNEGLRELAAEKFVVTKAL